MSSSVLVGYATRYGSTREVAEVVGVELRESGLSVDVLPVSEVRTLEGYGAIFLGTPLIMFHLHRHALGFIRRHRDALKEKPVAIFALGPVHEPHDAKEWQSSRDQLDKELAHFPWLEPVALEVFGGKFDPASLRFPLNVLAGKEPATDIRDWTAIRAWARDLSAKFRATLQ